MCSCADDVTSLLRRLQAYSGKVPRLRIVVSRRNLDLCFITVVLTGGVHCDDIHRTSRVQYVKKLRDHVLGLRCATLIKASLAGWAHDRAIALLTLDDSLRKDFSTAAVIPSCLLRSVQHGREWVSRSLSIGLQDNAYRYGFHRSRSFCDTSCLSSGMVSWLHPWLACWVVFLPFGFVRACSPALLLCVSGSGASVPSFRGVVSLDLEGIPLWPLL